MGTVPEEYLPPRELWPSRVYDLPEFKEYPDRFNSTEELLDKNVAAGRGDKVAIYFEDQAITYSQVLSTVNRLGSSLRQLGLGVGDRVLIRAPNIPPAIASNFAIIKIGAVSVPTSALLSRMEIVHIANNCEARAAIVAFPLLEEFEKAMPDLRTVQHVIVIGGKPEDISAKGFIPYQQMVARGSDQLEAVKLGRQDVSVLLYTSGTTGPPKGTAHFHEEAFIVPDGFGKYCWRVTENDVVSGPAPLAMAAGYSTVATIPYRFGAAASLIARFTPEAMFETVRRHRVTVLSALPTAYRKMLEAMDAGASYDLGSLRMCTGGGESLTARTYLDWKEKTGLEIYEGLGTTEMMYVFVSGAATLKVKPGSIGPAIPGYRVKVLNEEGKEAAPGEIGRMVARGPTGTLYWRDNAKQRDAIDNGWCRAGDYVHMDEDRYVWFVSRDDDLIKSSGYRIGPEEVEHALMGHPAVADVGVIGVPDPVRGQNTKAFVLLAKGFEPSRELEEELISFCRGRIAVYKLPRLVEFVDQLPRTTTGKLLRRILRTEAKQAAGSG